MQVNNKVLVVTGAGSGLGREITLKLLAKGATVAMVDVNGQGMTETARLAQVDSSRISQHVMSIADKELVLALPDKVIQTHGHVDGLLNVAGIIQPFVKLNDLDFDHIERVMNINFFGTLYMTKAFLPHLLQRPEGHIVNVASMGGFLPVPGQTIYGASKAAMKLMTEGLYAELKDTNVHVTLVLPGAMSTNIMNNSGVDMKGMDAESSSHKMLSPAEAADMVIAAMEKNAYRKLVGQDAWAMDKLYRLAPQYAVNMITKQMKDLLD